MEAIAKLKNCPLSPRKMRLIANQIRGKRVDIAMSALKFNQKPMYAAYVEKLLRSAISNWEQKNDGNRAEAAELFVTRVFVDSGKMLKRISPAPQGRAYRVRKRSNHITLIIDSKQEGSEQ